jgi:hypothetical protein
MFPNAPADSIDHDTEGKEGYDYQIEVDSCNVCETDNCNAAAAASALTNADADGGDATDGAVTTSSISGFATISGFESVAAFTAAHQLAFRNVLAALFGDHVSSEQIEVTVADAALRSRSRRLGDLAISYTVSGLTAADASDAASTITNLEPATFLDALTTEMERTGESVPDGMAIASIEASIDEDDAAFAGASAAPISSLVTLSTMIAVAVLY